MFGLTRWNPVDDVFSFQREVDRLFNQFWNDLPARTANGQSPSVQVNTTDDGWRIDVPLPLTVKRDGDELVKQPDEMLFVIRTMLTTLSGAEYRGRVPLAEGVEAFLFDRGGQGVLAVWDRGNRRDAKRLAINLGPRAAADRPRALRHSVRDL